MRHTPETRSSDKEYLEQFRRKTVQMRLPVSGSLELTSRCNLKCVHCYLGTQRGCLRDYSEEMSTVRVLSMLDEITEAGCLRFLITGGEPLLRKDFTGIYSHARKNGLLVTVFTNGTLITEEIIEVFKDLPPHSVEISLYGASAATYEKITGVRGSFEKCINGIERLLNAGINLDIKTVLMSINKHEFYDMEKIAAEYGIRFRFDAAIFPGFDGDRSPLALRVKPDEAVERDFSDKGRLRLWNEYFQRTQGIPVSEALYNCGAGVTGFHIDSKGSLSQCLMTSGLKYDLAHESFSDAWNNITSAVRSKKAGADFACAKCKKRSLCGFCPALFVLENGSEYIHSEYLCALGESRYEKLTLIGVKDGTE